MKAHVSVDWARWIYLWSVIQKKRFSEASQLVLNEDFPSFWFRAIDFIIPRLMSNTQQSLEMYSSIPLSTLISFLFFFLRQFWTIVIRATLCIRLKRVRSVRWKTEKHGMEKITCTEPKKSKKETLNLFSHTTIAARPWERFLESGSNRSL